MVCWEPTSLTDGTAGAGLAWLAASVPSPRAEEAIVVLNGCFCPVHIGHIRSLEATKRSLERDGTRRVVAAYLAVAPDHAVRKKVGRLERWMEVEARVAMCNAAAHDCLELGWTLSAAAFGGWKECGQAMTARHHSRATRVFPVPTVAKRRIVRKMADGDDAELTSTMIRAELAQSGARRETVDELVRRGILGQAVGESLLSAVGV
jgi:hypothetical protein